MATVVFRDLDLHFQYQTTEINLGKCVTMTLQMLIFAIEWHAPLQILNFVYLRSKYKGIQLSLQICFHLNGRRRRVALV